MCSEPRAPAPHPALCLWVPLSWAVHTDQHLLELCSGSRVPPVQAALSRKAPLCLERVRVLWGGLRPTKVFGGQQREG